MGVGRQAVEQLYRGTVEAFNERDWARYADGYAVDLEYWSPAATLDNREAMVAMFRRVVDAVPDLRLETLALSYDESSRVLMAEHLEHGTMTGEFVTPFGTLPPTGKSFEVRNACVIRVGEDGRAVSMREYMDPQEFLRQMSSAGRPG